MKKRNIKQSKTLWKTNHKRKEDIGFNAYADDFGDDESMFHFSDLDNEWDEDKKSSSTSKSDKEI